MGQQAGKHSPVEAGPGAWEKLIQLTGIEVKTQPAMGKEKGRGRDSIPDAH